MCCLSFFFYYIVYIKKFFSRMNLFTSVFIFHWHMYLNTPSFWYEEVCFIHRSLELEPNALFTPPYHRSSFPGILGSWPLILFQERNVPVMVDSSPLCYPTIFVFSNFSSFRNFYLFSQRKYAAQENLLSKTPFF